MSLPGGARRVPAARWVALTCAYTLLTGLVIACLPAIHPLSVTIRGVQYKVAMVRADTLQLGRGMELPQGRTVCVRGPAYLYTYRVGDWAYCYSWWDMRRMHQSPGW